MKKSLYILGNLEDQDLIWMSSVGIGRDVQQGELLIKAGEPVSDLFFVIRGNLAIVSEVKGEIASIGVGDVIGEMSFVEKRSPSVSVQAKSHSRVLAVPRDALLAEFVHNQGFAARFYLALAVFLSDRLRSMTGGVMAGEVENELDEGILDNLHVAGDRMLRLIDLLDGAAS